MSSPPPVSVSCQPEPEGWACEVTVGTDAAATRHQVTVPSEVLARLDPGAGDPEDLVRRSFGFLLEREPRESILRSFELRVIGRYFPDWEEDVRR